MLRDDFIDLALLEKITLLNLSNALLLFIVAYILFVFLPRRLFPQRYTGGGLENIVSNILYMLVYVELVVPLMVFLKVFSLFSFLAVLVATKLLVVRYYEKRSVKAYLLAKKQRFLVAIYDFLDEYDIKLKTFKKELSEGIFRYLRHLNYFQLFKKILIVAVFAHLIYVLGYRCFISLSYPLSDTSQFVEWVARLNENILYADHKTAGADFYGISVFIFFLQVFTHIDSIVLFNIYPLLLITFLFLGAYFVFKRFTLSSLVALATLLIYGSILVSSPWDQYLATPITTTNEPEIVRFLFFKIYQIPADYLAYPDQMLEKVAMTSYWRYFSGMAYEFSSAFFLINLFYLIKALDTGRGRYLINYTLSLMLVFIFHGGGAIALIVPSIFIAIHAFLSGKVSWSLLKRGVIAIVIAAIFGNGWTLSVLKYGIPQDFGAAAPFLDRLFGTKQAVKEIVSAGIEDVTISHLTTLHLAIVVAAILFFLIARVYKKGFYFSSFLLIPLGFFVVYFAENLGLPKLVHQSRGAEYLYLSTAIVVACAIRLSLWLPLKRLLGQKGKILFMGLVYLQLLFSALFVPHYKDIEFFKRFINGVQYSDIPYFLYKIIKQNRPLTWTVVSYVQEYSKVLGKGYMINVNEFIVDYNPLAKYLPIPTKKVYIFVEDIPHKYNGKAEWYYRWRKDIESRLKEWVTLYSTTHDNIRIFGKSKLLTVYEIDNSEYIRHLQKEKYAK